MEQCTMPIYKVKTCHTCSWMVGMNCGVCAENLCYSQNYWQLLSALIGLLKSPIACLSACSLSFSRSSAWICTGVTGWWKTTSLLMIWSNASSQGRGNTRLVCLCSFITVNSSTMPLSVLSYGFPAADIILLIRSSLDPSCQKLSWRILFCQFLNILVEFRRLEVHCSLGLDLLVYRDDAGSRKIWLLWLWCKWWRNWVKIEQLTFFKIYKSTI